jgi:hypothetical protein
MSSPRGPAQRCYCVGGVPLGSGAFKEAAHRIGELISRVLAESRETDHELAELLETLIASAQPALMLGAAEPVIQKPIVDIPHALGYRKFRAGAGFPQTRAAPPMGNRPGTNVPEPIPAARQLRGDKRLK